MSLTEALAIYASVVSTSVFAWNVYQSRARITVEIMGGFQEVSGQYVGGVTVVVRNRSPHKVHIAGVNLLYPKETSLRFRLGHYWQFKKFTRMVGWIHVPLNMLDAEVKSVMRGLGSFQLEGRQAHHVFIPRRVIDRVVGTAESQLRACAQDHLGSWTYSSRTYNLHRI